MEQWFVHQPQGLQQDERIEGGECEGQSVSDLLISVH